MDLLVKATLVIMALLPIPDLNAYVLKQVESSGLPAAPAPEPSAYEAPSVPIKVATKPLQLGAASAYAIDVTTGEVLYSSRPDTQRPIASITKLVTAMVILRSHNLDELVTIPALPTYTPDDALVGLKPGSVFTVRDLLAGLLIHSGNDAADALAIADSGSREAFAAKMNRFVAEWGIMAARFSNPSGLGDNGNSASAEALAKISLLALRNPTVTSLVKTPTATITSKDGQIFKLETTDHLLQSGRFHGIKTGYTVAAGQCFVGLTTIQGHQVITVILGSQDRFGESMLLADWINTTYQWQ